jgi:hypothetical protein
MDDRESDMTIRKSARDRKIHNQPEAVIHNTSQVLHGTFRILYVEGVLCDKSNASANMANDTLGEGQWIPY